MVFQSPSQIGIMKMNSLKFGIIGSILFIAGCQVAVDPTITVTPVYTPVYTQNCRWVDDIRYDYYGRVIYHNSHYLCR